MADRSLRASVTLVDLQATTTRVVPVAEIDYVLLTVAAAMDTSGRYRYITDAFAVVDNISFSLTKSLSDSFSAVDTAPAFVVSKPFADSVSFTELFSAMLIFLRNFTDTQGFSDVSIWTVNKPLADTVTFSDTKSFVLTRSFSDGFAMNDSFDLGDGSKYTFTKSINNVVFLDDSFSQIISKTVADSVTMSDSGLGSMQSYCDITYFAEDYVGISWTFDTIAPMTPSLPPPGSPVVFEYIGFAEGDPDTLLVNLRCPHVGSPTFVLVGDINGGMVDASSEVDATGLAPHSIFVLGLDLSELSIEAIVITDDGMVTAATTWSP